MTTQVLNFLWLNLELPAPPDPADGSIRAPLPEGYIEDLCKAGLRHPKAAVMLWIDSERLTEKQMDYLRDKIGQANVQLKDLREIPEYRDEGLYNEAETDRFWRTLPASLIWRQVDAAKVLISLQGDFDQTFFTDLDHAHLDIAASPVQKMLEKHGLMFGSLSVKQLSVENQLWGFTRERRKFFEEYYADVLKDAARGEHGWGALSQKTKDDLEYKGVPRKEFCLRIDGSGIRAEQPGSVWQDGNGHVSEPSLISVVDIAAAFNANNKPRPPAAKRGMIARLKQACKQQP